MWGDQWPAQYSSGQSVAVAYVMRFKLDGAAWEPLLVGNSVLLRFYSKADALSHFQFQWFYQQAPHVSPAAMPVTSLLLAQLPVA